ncbi:MAG: Competence protein ComEA [Sporanaerobacter sp.]|uniref:helix-hairpin-helix domain-containing protein n=1 Tax=Sporanaerobacter sp. TaxID=2010183 RepID=UPI003A100657
MRFFTKREQIVILVLVILVVFIIFFNLYNKNVLLEKDLNLDEFGSNKLNEMDEGKIKEENEAEEIIMVHISGQVYKPGLVELKNGSRVIDAVNSAGGLKSEADLDRINLAKKLVDEEKIYIPKIGEANDMVDEVEISDGVGSENSSENRDNKININTCTKEELMNLPGIGEVLATRIVEYRQSTKFNSIEDIMNVSGIGNKKFENIKDLITVK